MSKQKRKKNLLKSLLTITLTGFLLMSSITTINASSGDVVEYSDYHLQYTLKVPAELNDRVTKLSASRINIQFSDSVYLALAIDDYYDDLSSEQIGDNSRSDYSIGNDILDETYNNDEFMNSYFSNKLNSIRGKKRIESIELIDINKTPFWVCHYFIYQESVDSQTNELIQTDVGEGQMYYNMTDGISYYMLVNSNDEFLALTPEAIHTAETIKVGKKVSPFIYVLWGIVALMILIFLVILNNKYHFIEVEVEDEDGTTHTLTGSIRIKDTDIDPNAETVVIGELKHISALSDEQAFQNGDTQITQVMPLQQDNKLNTGQIMEKINDLKKVFADKNRKLEESFSENESPDLISEDDFQHTGTLNENDAADTSLQQLDQAPMQSIKKVFSGFMDQLKNMLNKPPVDQDTEPDATQENQTNEITPDLPAPSDDSHQNVLDALDNLLGRNDSDNE